jgi:hypothetical protein
MVYISRFNFTPVSVNFGSFILSDIPLFYVIIGSIVFGLILSYLFSLIKSISTSVILRGKNNELKKDKNEILELTKNVHQLELENEKIKNGSEFESTDPKAL